MKNFARVMGLLFGSARAHTYPKSGQVGPLARISSFQENPSKDHQRFVDATAIFIMVVSPAVLAHDVSARAGDVSMRIAVFPIG